MTGNEDRFALNDTITSVFAGMLSQCFKLVFFFNKNFIAFNETT